jgi:hypothetical protein
LSFLNIFDLAQHYGISKLETSSLIKAKRRILAEIELDDDEVEIRNQTFSKSDVLNLFDEIDKNENVLTFHKTIFQNQNLNAFLYGTSSRIPTKAFHDPLGRTNTDFTNYISPFFAKQFGNLYKKAFEEGNIEVLKFNPPISAHFLEDIYSPILKKLEDLKNDLTLSNVESKISNSVIEKLNALPQYFMKSRSDIALRIRSLSVDAWNKKEDLDLAFKILDLAFELDVNSSTKQKLDEDEKGLEDLEQKQKEANTCQICGSRQIEKDTFVKIPIYKATRELLMQGQYQTNEAKLPACSVCYEESINNSSAETASLIKIIFFIGITILFWGFPLIFFLGKESRENLIRGLSPTPKNFDQYKYQKHPIIKLLETDGWKIGREPSRSDFY